MLLKNRHLKRGWPRLGDAIGAMRRWFQNVNTQLRRVNV